MFESTPGITTYVCVLKNGQEVRRDLIQESVCQSASVHGEVCHSDDEETFTIQDQENIPIDIPEHFLGGFHEPDIDTSRLCLT